MNKPLVYDLPTRLFHWLFAGFFITAFAIANGVDDESARFPLHMLAGLGMVFVLLLRLAWSLVGTRHARLGDLALRPSLLLGYFKGMFTGGSRRWTGHNPASSWAAVAMVALALGLGTTGLLMASGNGGDTLEEAHELMANLFLAVVLLHVGGVLVHVLRYRDALPAAMVTGHKRLPADAAVADARPAVRHRAGAGVAFLLLTGVFVGWLAQNYDAQARSLALFGTSLQLGEDEHGEHHERDGERGHDGDDIDRD